MAVSPSTSRRRPRRWDGFGTYDVLTGIEGIDGTNAADIMYAGNDGNEFDGRGGVDMLTGGDGDDQFTGGSGDDQIDGGAGSDRVDYSREEGLGNSAGVFVDLGAETAIDTFSNSDTLVSIEHVRGTHFEDTLTGSDNQLETETFEGLGGDDVIDGKGGIDRIAYHNEHFFGGGSGIVLNLATLTATDTFDATDTFIATDTFSNVEQVSGSAFDDFITGDANHNRIEGNGGSDTIDGGEGFDIVSYGNEHNRAIDVARTIFGSLGISADLALGTVVDTYGSTDFLSNIEAIDGSIFGDTIAGNADGNELFGNDGNDIIIGRGGADYLDGGAGDDRIIVPDLLASIDGGSDNDTLALSDGVSLDLTDPQAPAIVSIERIDLSEPGDQMLTIDETAVLELTEQRTGTDGRARIRVDGGAGDTVRLADLGWVLLAPTVVGYNLYQKGEAEVLIDTDIAVENVVPLSSSSPQQGVSIFGAAAGDNSGFSVASAGDINGDGLGDVIVGAPDAVNASGTYAGAAYVVFGGTSLGNIDLAALLADQGFTIQGPALSQATGRVSPSPRRAT